MVEIIPNWHPIFVHFTVALLSLAVLLIIVTPFLKSPLQEQWRIVSRWALWFGTGFALITGLTGWYAYNTVAHDTPSHAAMTDHRNWALVTIGMFVVLAVWSVMRVRRKQVLGAAFIAAMLVAGGVLASTAWRGGEVVYRYGLGVISLPQADGEGHAHEHGDGEGHGHATEMPASHSMTDTTHELQDSSVDHHTDSHDHTDGNDHSAAHARDHHSGVDSSIEGGTHDGTDASAVSAGNKSDDHNHADGHNHQH